MAARDLTTLTVVELELLAGDESAGRERQCGALLELLERGPRTHTVTLSGADLHRTALDTFGVVLGYRESRRAA